MGKPNSSGLIRKEHIAAYYIRREEPHDYAKLIERVSPVTAVYDQFDINPDTQSDSTRFYQSFNRYAMYMWRVLLYRDTQQPQIRPRSAE